MKISKKRSLQRVLTAILSIAMIFTSLPVDMLAGVFGGLGKVRAAGDIDDASENFAITWDFKNAVPSTITSTNIQGTNASGTVTGSYPDNKKTKMNTYASSHMDLSLLKVSAATESTKTKLQYRSSGDAQINNGTVIRVPLVKGNNSIKISAYPGYAYWKIIKPDETVLESESARPNEETVEISNVTGYDSYLTIQATNTAYIYSIINTISTSEFTGDDDTVSGKNVAYTVTGAIENDTNITVWINDGNEDASLNGISGNANLTEGKTYSVKYAVGDRCVYNSSSEFEVTSETDNVSISLTPIDLSLNYNNNSDMVTLLTNMRSDITGSVKNSLEEDINITYIKGGFSDFGYYKNGYGFKGKSGSALFSFVADQIDKNYTVKLYATQNKGVSTAHMYRNNDTEDVVAEAASVEDAKTGNLEGTQYTNTLMFSYHKETEDSETIYVSVDNVYLVGADVIVTDYEEPTKALYTGGVSGIIDDDSNVKITLKSVTDTLEFEAGSYESDGVDLNIGETYSVTAAGDKYVYYGKKINVTEDPDDTTIYLTRIRFDLPLDLATDFDNISLYLKVKGYNGETDVTDADSGITVYGGGMNMYNSQYGAKANAENILSL